MSGVCLVFALDLVGGHVDEPLDAGQLMGGRKAQGQCQYAQKKKKKTKKTLPLLRYLLVGEGGRSWVAPTLAASRRTWVPNTFVSVNWNELPNELSARVRVGQGDETWRRWVGGREGRGRVMYPRGSEPRSVQWCRSAPPPG